MPDKIIVYWRDIPTQVMVRMGRASSKRELSPRFMEAVDRAAMRSGAHGTDAYLADWRRSAPEACSGEIEAEADAALAQIEGEYGQERLDQLVKNGGREG